MELFYQNELKAAGYSEKSEMYRLVKNYIDGESAKVRYRQEVREKLGITVNSFSAFVDENGHSEAFIAVEEMPEENILHQIEMDDFRDCLQELSDEDLDFLMTCVSERGAMARIARETGIAHSTLSYRKKKLYKVIRRMMKKKGY